MTIRTLRNTKTGIAVEFDLSNVAHLLQYQVALDTGIFTDDSELSGESSEPSEDEIREELAQLRAEYEKLEQAQDDIQMRIRVLAKRLPESEQSKLIPCPF